MPIRPSLTDAARALCAAVTLLAAGPALAQGEGIDAAIARSDSDGGTEVTPAAPDAPEGLDPGAPSGARVDAGRTVTVEIDPEPVPERADAPADRREEAPPMDGAPALAAEEVPLSAILGLPVRGADGAERGTVADVIVSLATGRLVGIEVESGGVLGLGAETERVGIERVALDPLGQAVVVTGEGG
jgi:sporulation protein YlmC with PRC-barrel domain